MEQLLSVKEAAARLAVPEDTIRAWIYRGRLPRVKLGRATRLRQSDLEFVVRVGLPSPAGKES